MASVCYALILDRTKYDLNSTSLSQDILEISKKMIEKMPENMTFLISPEPIFSEIATLIRDPENTYRLEILRSGSDAATEVENVKRVTTDYFYDPVCYMVDLDLFKKIIEEAYIFNHYEKLHSGIWKLEGEDTQFLENFQVPIRSISLEIRESFGFNEPIDPSLVANINTLFQALNEEKTLDFTDRLGQMKTKLERSEQRLTEFSEKIQHEIGFRRREEQALEEINRMIQMNSHGFIPQETGYTQLQIENLSKTSSNTFDIDIINKSNRDYCDLDINCTKKIFLARIDKVKAFSRKRVSLTVPQETLHRLKKLKPVILENGEVVSEDSAFFLIK